MFPYLPNTKQDEERMLEALGIEDVDELFGYSGFHPP